MSRNSSPSWDTFRRDSRISPRDDAGTIDQHEIHHETLRIGGEEESPPERPSMAERPRASQPPQVTPPKRGAGRRIARYALGLAAGLGLSVVFVGSFAAALVAHVNTPVSRRAIASVVSDVSSASLKGKIELADVRHVGLRDLDVGRVTIRDPQGREVIVARDTKVRFDLFGLAKGALAAKPTIAIESVSLAEVDVTLIDDGTGSPTIANTFAPKVAKPDVAPQDSDMRIVLRRIDLAVLKVDGNLSGNEIHTVGSLEKTSVATDPFEGTVIGLSKVSLEVQPVAGILKNATSLTIGTTVHIPGEKTPTAPGVDLTDLVVDAANGTMTAKITGNVSNGRIAARLAAHAEPKDVAQFTGQPPPVWAPIDLDVGLDGSMSAMRVDAKAVLGAAKEGSVRVTGAVDLEGLGQKVDAKHPRILVGEALVDLENIDARAFAPDAPAIRTSADIAVRATAVETGIEVTYVAKKQPLDPTIEDPFEKKVIPGIGQTIVALDGKALIKTAGGVSAEGNAYVSVERARAEVGYHVDIGPTSSKASIVAHVVVPALSELKLVKSPVRGSIELDLTADADLAAQTFVATGQLRGTELRKDDARIATVVVDLNAQGKFSDPAFSAKVTAPTLEVLDPKNPYAKPIVRDLVLDVAGTPGVIAVATKFTTAKDQKIDLATHVVPTKTGVRVVGLDAKVSRDKFRAEVKLKELVVDNGDFKLVGFKMASTAGGLRLDGAWSPRRHQVDLDIASTELDLPGLAYAAGVDIGKMEGTVSIEGKLKTIPRKAHPEGSDGPIDTNGMLSVQLDAPSGKPTTTKIGKNDGPVLVGHLKIHTKGNGVFPSTVPVPAGLGAYDGTLDIDIDDRLVQLGVDAQVKDLVKVALHGGGALAGRYDDAKSWINAAGHLAFAVPEVDLAHVAKVVGQLQGKPLPLAVAGSASFYAQLLRPDPLLPPMGSAKITGKQVAIATPTLSLEPMDLDLTARFARADDKSKAADTMMLTFGADVTDAVGSLVKLQIKTDAAWSKIQQFANGTIADPKKFLEEMPVYARLVVPKRHVNQFPAVVRSSIPLDGDLYAKVTIDGTVAAPLLALETRLSDVKAGTGTPHTLSLDGAYDGKIATVHAAVFPDLPGKKIKDPSADASAIAATATTSDADTKTKAEKKASRKAALDAAKEGSQLTADAEVKIDAKDLFAPASPTAPLPWTAKADVSLKGLPLAMFSSLAAVDIAGVVDGEIHVDHVNDPAEKSATVDAKIDVDALTIGDTTFETSTLEAKVDATHATAKLVLEGESGNMHANADVPLLWKTALSPGVAPGGKVVASLDAKNFRLRTVEPFATPFDALDGYIDADVKVAMTPKAGGGFDGGATGTVKLRDGIMIVGAIGERWEGVTGDIAISPQLVTVKSFALKGHTGDANVSGSLTMAGLAPQKLHVQLDAKRFPFATNGVPVGDLSGKVVVDGDLTKKEMADFVITIDPMTVDLAETSGKNPQDLEPEPSIVILQPVEEPPPPPSSGGMPMTFAIHMPNNVWIRRADLRMAVNGNAKVVIKNVASISGEVQVDEGSHGYAEVFGKRFLVDHARVTFDGSADINPVLDIAVKWEAPDGSTVTVAVTGRLQQPKVELSSDPSGTQAEIMSLLVLGRRDAGSAAQQDQASKGAAAQTASMVQGMTGAIIGQQLQKALPTSMSLSFQPGENGFADAKYGGGYQKGKFYFEVGYNAGAGNASTSAGPSTAQYDPKTTFGVEYRFKPMWSLMTTLGDTGSALVDLLWNYRY